MTKWSEQYVPGGKPQPENSYEQKVFLQVRPINAALVKAWEVKGFKNHFQSPDASGVERAIDCVEGILKAVDAIGAPTASNAKLYLEMFTALPTGVSPPDPGELVAMGAEKVLEYIDHYKAAKKETGKLDVSKKKTPTQALMDYYRTKDMLVSTWAAELLAMADAAMLHIGTAGMEIKGVKARAEKVSDPMRAPLVLYVNEVRARLHYYSKSKTKMKALL